MCFVEDPSASTCKDLVDFPGGPGEKGSFEACEQNCMSTLDTRNRFILWFPLLYFVITHIQTIRTNIVFFYFPQTQVVMILAILTLHHTLYTGAKHAQSLTQPIISIILVLDGVITTTMRATYCSITTLQGNEPNAGKPAVHMPLPTAKVSFARV